MQTDVSAARVFVVQGSLFPPSPREVCDRIGLNWWAAVRLHEAAWLSFDPQKLAKLEEDQEAELVFVGSLVAGGCDDAMLKQLLAGLEKPYQYRAHQMYYDWVDKTWRLLPIREDPDPEELFNYWVNELVQTGEIDKIVELKTSISDAENQCNKELERVGEETMRWEAEQKNKKRNSTTRMDKQ